MNEEWKAKWVAALRSGEYEQGSGGLNITIENTYCCLGVLCNLVNPNGWQRTEIDFEEDWHDEVQEDGTIIEILEEVEVERTLDMAMFQYGSVADDSFVPSSMEELVGLTRNDCEIASVWNDQEKLNFEQIADKIEEVF